MEPSGSISCWIDRLAIGDDEAVESLWERFFPRMVQLARRKLHNSPRQAADEEDVALSAFDSFCRHAEQGHYPDLHDRNSLWRLLAIITARKVLHLQRTRQEKREAGIEGPGHV